jgi:hypothetical protein
MDPTANIEEQVEIARSIARKAMPQDMPPTFLPIITEAQRLAELVIALDEWRNQGGFAPAAAPASTDTDQLLAIHRMLFPERYPREVQPDHVFWENHDESDCISTPEMGGAVFEWDSGTIELVAHMLERALADDPRARLKP